jgi:hypothetical protein
MAGTRSIPILIFLIRCVHQICVLSIPLARRTLFVVPIYNTKCVFHLIHTRNRLELKSSLSKLKPKHKLLLCLTFENVLCWFLTKSQTLISNRILVTNHVLGCPLLNQISNFFQICSRTGSLRTKRNGGRNRWKCECGVVK